jgi:tetratricopeptide (TPR) repeat protein
MSHHVNPAWLLGDHPSEGTSRATETLATYQQAKIDTVRVSVRWLGAGYNPPDSLVAEIVNTLRNALAHAPDYGRAKVLLAEALAVEGSRASAAGTIDKAIASFNEALALNPYQSDANRMLGVAMRDQRRFADSLPHFEAALSRHPDDAGTRFNYGVALFSLKRLEDARLQFEQSLASRPNNANAHRQLGMTLLNQARPASR